MDPLLQPDPQRPLEKTLEPPASCPNQPSVPNPVPKPPSSDSHDDEGTKPAQQSHFAGTPRALGNHVPAACPPLALYRYLAYPYLHEMRALGLPALAPSPGAPSASVPPAKSPCASAESGDATPPGPAESSTLDNLAPRRESLPSTDSSISLSPSPPAHSSSEEDMESGIDLRGLARVVRRERDAKTMRCGMVYRVKKVRKREELKKS